MIKKKYFIFFLLIFYLFFQLSSLDYGKKINDFNYIEDNSQDTSYITNQILKKKTIIDNKNKLEDTKKKFFRFKLYSIEADEMLSIMALGNIAIKKKIDPNYYQYGGSFLYPLGIYYFVLKKLKIIEFNNYEELLKNENKVDLIYFYGRLFVLLSFIISSYILYLALKLLTSRNSSLKLVALYLFVPSSLMFSQIIKPHWYSLIWINLIIYNLIKLKTQNNDSLKRLIYLSIFMGLCVGSAFYNLIFVAIAYLFVLFYLQKQNSLKINYILISSLFLLLSFSITNPAFILNGKSLIIEMERISAWFKGSIDFSKVLNFYKNSLITGFGLANIIFLVYSLFSKEKFKYFYSLILILITPVIFMSFLTAQQHNWHINFRYIPFFLSAMLIFFALIKNKKKSLILNILISLTIIQMYPLKLAYYDENNEKYSTRLNASKWIEENINVDNRVCLNSKTPAPFNTPPINFNKFNIVDKKCDWKIITIRNTGDYKKIMEKNIEIVFKPRLLYQNPRTVFSHINPVIAIIKK